MFSHRATHLSAVVLAVPLGTVVIWGLLHDLPSTEELQLHVRLTSLFLRFFSFSCFSILFIFLFRSRSLTYFLAY